MKLKHIFAAGALALAGGALAVPQVHATPSSTTSYANGDLFLGIRSLGGTGSSTDILIDLGQVTNLFSNFSQTGTLDLSGLATLLSNTYGTGWASNVNVTFSLIGGDTVGDNLYATNPSSAHWVAGPDESTPANDIASMATSFQNNAATITSNGLTQAVSQSNSFASFMPGVNSNTEAFDFFNPTIEQTVAQAAKFEHVPEGGTDKLLGTFTLTQNGTNAGDANLTFTVVPEPSTWAIFGAGALFLVVLHRRRRLA